MNEDFDFSDMSSVDYTDTFADTDDNAVNERMTDIKKWVTYNIFGIDWNTSNERTRDFIDNVVMVTVETDGYHMSIVLPEDDFTDELSLWQVTMNLFKSVQFGNNGISYAMPAGSTTGMYPGLKLDRFVCDGFTDGEITIRVDTNNFK